MTESGNPLVRKLSRFADLTSGERDQIGAWCAHPVSLKAHNSVIREGDRPEATCLMLSGWACRYKDLRDGSRQIVDLLLPGDMCDLHGFLLASADHSIAVLSDAVAALVPSAEILAGLDREPRLVKALWWSTLVTEGITREWVVNVGQRNAVTRIAHLMCELWTRADVVGILEGGALGFPLTQGTIGHATGLTDVHVNRSLRMLREEGLATLTGRRLIIPDFARLASFAGFDPTYLQLHRRH